MKYPFKQFQSVAVLRPSTVSILILVLCGRRAEGWKVAAALCARHIGGAVNYVGVVETLGVSPASQVGQPPVDCFILLFHGGRRAVNINPLSQQLITEHRSAYCAFIRRSLNFSIKSGFNVTCNISVRTSYKWAPKVVTSCPTRLFLLLRILF
jgi:hypothetical protein